MLVVLKVKPRCSSWGRTCREFALTTAKNPWMLDYLALGALWGSSFLFMHFATAEFGPLATAAGRVGIAAAFLLPIVIIKGKLGELQKHWKKIFFMGIFNSAIPFACFAFSLLSITTGLSAILNATVPMFGALVAWVWLKDKPALSRIAGILIGFTGIALLAWDKATFRPDATGATPGWAVLACLLACLCYGISANFTKKYMGGIHPMVTAAGSQMGATLGLLVPAIWLWPARTPSTSAWLAMLILGVACTGIAYILYFRLIANAGPQRTLTVTFLIPVFAVIYGAVFLRESITPWMMLCAVVIVCGTALATGLIRFRASLPRH
ncbi:MAG: DMT family transporter [Vitreoscilla sp.]|nr:DMT family transporter [Polaromonas sp.]